MTSTMDGPGVALGAFRLAWRHAGTYARTQGIVAMLATLPTFAVTMAFVGPVGKRAFDAVLSDGFDFALLLPLVGAVVGLFLLAALASSFIHTAAMGIGLAVTDALLAGERLTLAQAWARVRPRYWNLFATGLLVSLAMMGILLVGLVGALLVVPLLLAVAGVLYLLVRWAVAAPAAVFERHKVTENLARSSDLTMRARGPVAIAFVLYAVGALLVGSVASLPFQAAGQMWIGGIDDPFAALGVVFSPAYFALLFVGEGLKALVVSVVGAAFTTTLYRALVLVERAGEAPPAPPAPSEAGTALPE